MEAPSIFAKIREPPSQRPFSKEMGGVGVECGEVSVSLVDPNKESSYIQ